MDEELARLQKELTGLEELEKNLNIKSDDFASPQTPDKDSVFKFFREILKSEDSTKTGFMDSKDMKAIRIYQDLSLFAESQNLDLISKYFFIQGEIIASTSMSKNAKFLDLIVTQIKKSVGTSSLSAIDRPKSFWDRFRKSEPPQEGTT